MLRSKPGEAKRQKREASSRRGTLPVRYPASPDEACIRCRRAPDERDRGKQPSMERCAFGILPHLVNAAADAIHGIG